MAISKFWLNVFEEMVGYLPSNHFWLLKRELALSIFNRVSPLRSFYDNSFDTKCPNLSKEKCAHVALQLGSAVALPIIKKSIRVVIFQSEHKLDNYFSLRMALWSFMHD